MTLKITIGSVGTKVCMSIIMFICGGTILRNLNPCQRYIYRIKGDKLVHLDVWFYADESGEKSHFIE